MVNQMIGFEKSGVSYPFWVEFVKPRMIALKGGECEKCSSTKYLDIHHTRYDVQTIHTLQVLCRKCHKEWHKEHGDEAFLLEKYGVVHPENLKHSQSCSYEDIRGKE